MLLILFFFVVILLLFPDVAAQGSRNGLVLWATILVPSLFPFSVLTSIIRTFIKGNAGKYLLIITGILSGYPMGAKISGELYLDGMISKKTAVFLTGFTNNPSPMFVIFFVGQKSLNLSYEKYVFYAFVILSSFIGSLLYTRFTSQKSNKIGYARKKAELVTPCPLTEQIDEEIASSALLLIKIGGYVMLFSIATALIQRIGWIPNLIKVCTCGLLEITTGNAMITASGLTTNMKIILSLAATTFGGLSAAAQTNSVIRKTGLSTGSYIMMKSCSCLTSILLSLVFIQLFI